MSLTIGDTFAGYRVLRLLGSGGMGQVYLVQHPRLPRQEALKVLRPDISRDPSFRERFTREADLAAGLRHPHIVGIHDRGEHDGQLWIAMDYIDGTDLSHLQEQRYPQGMPVGHVLTITTAIASALDYAHKKGLLHRDIKPANIIVADIDSNEPSVFLADFGIARPLDDTVGITTTNMTVGTVAYAAPEQLMGEDIDGRADQYALAATTYHLLTGTQVFPHSNPAVVISRHLNSAAPKLSDGRRDLRTLDTVLQTALAKDPKYRFVRCAEFASSLASMEPASAKSDTLLSPQSRKSESDSALESRTDASPTRVRRMRVAVGAIVGVCLLCTVIVVGWRPWDGQRPLAADNTSTAQTSPATTTMSASAPPSPPPLSVPSATTSQTVDPALTAPAAGSDCAHAQINVVTTSSSGTPIRCAGGPGGYSWQPDSGVDAGDPGLIGQLGWDGCIQQFTEAACVTSAASVVNSPNTSGPVFPDGVYDVPNVMPFGTYAAIPGPEGSCSFYAYDSTGKLHESQTYTNRFDKPVVEVDPFVSNGRFQTRGCSPWVMIKPLSPDW